MQKLKGKMERMRRKKCPILGDFFFICKTLRKKVGETKGEAGPVREEVQDPSSLGGP